MLGAIHKQLFQMPRKYKRLVMVAADAILIPLALLSAFAMRLGIEEFEPERFIWWFLVAPAIAIPAFVRLGLYRAVVRYMGPQAAFAVLKGVTFATISLMILVLSPHYNPTWPMKTSMIWLSIILSMLMGLMLKPSGRLKTSSRRGIKPPSIQSSRLLS